MESGSNDQKVRKNGLDYYSGGAYLQRDLKNILILKNTSIGNPSYKWYKKMQL